jgi:hypothetical protein
MTNLLETNLVDVSSIGRRPAALPAPGPGPPIARSAAVAADDDADDAGSIPCLFKWLTHRSDIRRTLD